MLPDCLSSCVGYMYPIVKHTCSIFYKMLLNIVAVKILCLYCLSDCDIRGCKNRLPDKVNNIAIAQIAQEVMKNVQLNMP